MPPSAPAAQTDLLVTACHSCAQEGPTKRVTFRQNIGVVLLRFTTDKEGRFCKTCLRHHFWRTTLVTLVFGWWGLLSFFVTLFILPANVLTMLRAARLPEPNPRPASWSIVLAQIGIGAALVGLGALVAALDVELSQENRWNDMPSTLLFLALSLVCLIAPGCALWASAFFGIKRGRGGS